MEAASPRERFALSSSNPARSPGNDPPGEVVPTVTTSLHWLGRNVCLRRCWLPSIQPSMYSRAYIILVRRSPSFWLRDDDRAPAIVDDPWSRDDVLRHCLRSNDHVIFPS